MVYIKNIMKIEILKMNFIIRDIKSMAYARCIMRTAN